MFDFTLLTENAPQAPRWLAASVAAHSLAIVLLFAIRFSGVVSSFPRVPPHFILLAPAPETRIARPMIAAAPRVFHPLPPSPLRVERPSLRILPAPAIEIPKPVLPDLPRATAPLAVAIPVIKPAAFAEVKPVVLVPAPKLVVKAAGFESSETSAAGPARGAPANLGSFDSAHTAERAPARAAIGGQGAFSDASSSASGTLARRTITGAAFGDTTIEKGSAAPRQTAAAARMTAVEILSKPKPAYTAEARAKNIEGEVLLEVQFNVAGDLRILRMVRGLGYGLDESALAAAQGIRFRPAMRDGSAVDSTALVHIVFQLAN